MKVCFIAGTLGRGGAEKQLYYMVRSLLMEGVEISVVSLTNGEHYQNEIESLGIRVEWLGRSESRLRRLAEIISTVKKIGPDIIQSAHFYTNLYAGLAGRLLRIRSIGAVRNDLFSEVQAHGLLGKWQATVPDGIIANSRCARQRLIDSGFAPARVRYVPNVIDLPELKPNGRKGSSVNIIFVGRLVEQKNPFLFLEVAKLLTARFSQQELSFNVAGDGPLRTDLEQLVEANKQLFGDVRFLGELADLSELYRAADILVLCSKHEGVPNVVLEAMSFGIPIVATRVGGVEEIASTENALLVPGDDAAALADAVGTLVSDPQLRRAMGAAGRKVVEDSKTPDRLASQLKEIYTKLLEKH